MTNASIAIIGAGNMGSSIIGGLIRDGHPPSKIIASNIDPQQCDQLENTFQIKTTTDNFAAASEADVVVLSVKPQLLMQVCEELSETIQKNKPLVLSIAAGVSEQAIEHKLGNDIAIVRVMPNTPALIGCGASALFANQAVSQAQHDLAESIMRAVGVTIWAKTEDEIDTVTALSGSGPAYFFLMMEALQAAAEELGLSAENAKLLTLQTALGASRLALESDVSLAELRRRVTSPGGTTEKGVATLENANIRDILKDTLVAAKNRSKELAAEFGDK